MIFRVSGKLSESHRTALVFICCLVLMWLFFFSDIRLGAGEVQIAGSVLFIFITIFSINGELRPIRLNRYTFYPLVLFGLGILLIGQIHYVGDGYMMYALDLAFIFPALYFVWANRGDIEKLYMIVSVSIIIFGIVSFVYCYYLAAKGDLGLVEGRVSGYKNSPNYYGMFGVLMLISSLYLLSEKPAKPYIVLPVAVSMGIGLVYPVITVSRTAMAAEIICLLAMLIYYLKPAVRKSGINRLSRKMLLCIILIAGVMFAAGIKMDDLNYRAQEAEAASADITVEVHSGQAAQDAAGGQTAASEADKLTERLDVSDDANSLSSGRLEIWSIYAKEFSLWGKSYKELKPELQAAVENRAHNNIVDYLFRCGYVVGLLYILFYIAQGITGLVFLFGKAYKRPIFLFSVMMVGTYSVYAMLEISTLAFIRIIPCVYFLTLAPVIADFSKDEGEIIIQEEELS